MNPRDTAPPSAHLVVVDVDSTLINEEVIELIADLAGTRDQVAAITSRAMRGELDFGESLRERVATLAGVPTAAVADVANAVTVTQGATSLIAAVQQAGGVVGAVSGGFAEVLQPLARRLELDHWRANRLEHRDGRLTGRLSGPIIDAAAKRQALHEWSRAHGIPRERTVAVGDGANDLEMMAAAGLSVAFDAKPAVRERANVCIDSRDLSEVLGLIGLAP